MFIKSLLKLKFAIITATESCFGTQLQISDVHVYERDFLFSSLNLSTQKLRENPDRN